MYLSDIFTIACNLAGLPGLSMPAGFIDGLPIGAQLLGPHFSEATLLHIAHQYQQKTDWHQRIPAIADTPR
jgi:aspartyl-tRNA(Asn)/glutamyl-tRNA(Gln) amidotransferase subunit A